MALAWLFPDLRIVIRGAGDLASGVAYRLVKSGFPVIMTERAQPLLVRRTVSYGNAIFEGGSYSVEGIQSVLAQDAAAAEAVLVAGQIPVVIDEAGDVMRALKPDVVVDARMQKRNIDTTLHDAALILALGPGFTAGVDCHAVIETNRGHKLGRVIWQGRAQADTGTPGTVSGYSAERVLRAPGDGYVIPAPGIEIGVRLNQGDLIASLEDIPIRAPFPGVLRGLIHSSVKVRAGLKIGDLDPRGDAENCFTISDKSLAIGGGVLEAVLSAPVIREKISGRSVENVSL